jgi:hypothetical protein
VPKWGGLPSARWLLPEDTHFSKSYKEQLNSLIAERFKVSTTIEAASGCTRGEARNAKLKQAKELFYLCYHYVDNLSPRPQIFNAQYGLFRCLFGLFASLSALSILGIIVALIAELHTAHSFLLLAGLFGACSWLSYERCKKRSEDFAQSIYDLFVAGVAAKPAS